VAQRVRAADPNIKLVKYIGPQVWATRPGRAKTLAAAVDHLICIHDFEMSYYEPYDLPCSVCGHPAVGRYKPGDGPALRARQGIGEKEKIILVLPGSRNAEVRRIGPTLWRAAELLDRDRGVRIITVAAASVRQQVMEQVPPAVRIIDEHEKEDAFAAATVALAASGTVTTEVALQGTPVVVAYKLGWITWALARWFLFKAKYASLLNVAADAEVAPEFLQTRCTPENIAAAAAPLLDNQDAREEQVRHQDEALAKMGRGGTPAAEIAADVVLRLAGKPN
jgi:lipid-A-disaccharide synthase